MKMNNLINYVLNIIFLFLPFLIEAQEIKNSSKRWDESIIEDANIWRNLLVGHYSADRYFNWEERKEALSKIISNNPNSKWADDASILLIGEEAIIENNIDKAITELRKIIKKYPSENTIIVGWNKQRGCLINEAWLMWAPSLVIFNEDYSIRTIYPFDKDHTISFVENEVLTYFQHLEKYPQSTKDVAQFLIANMLYYQGNIDGAIYELENICTNNSYLTNISLIDYEASQKRYGYLIEYEPPSEISPMWRVQYAAILMLVELYSKQKNISKVLELAARISNDCSSDGWNWNINKCLGDIYAKNNLIEEAIKEYDLSIHGIIENSKHLANRMKVLFEEGYLVKSKDFINWDEEAIKSQSNRISDIQYLKDQISSGIVK